MKLDERTPSGREKDQEAVELLDRLRRKLHSRDISTARLAAFSLSWKQEDGFEILHEALFGDFSRTAKKAAAYGLRSMKGRMKKMATEVLEEGRKHSDKVTREACETAIAIMNGNPPKRAPRPRGGRGRSKHRGPRGNIRGISNKSPREARFNRSNRPRFNR